MGSEVVVPGTWKPRPGTSTYLKESKGTFTSNSKLHILSLIVSNIAGMACLRFSVTMTNYQVIASEA